MEGFTRTEIKTSGARIVTVHGGKGPPLLLMHGNPFTHLSWHKFAPRLARGIHGGRDRPARLRRFIEKPPSGREPRELFVPRHGAGPGRGDGGARLQDVHGGRPRPRRARDCTACASIIRRRCSAPRSSTSSRSTTCSTTSTKPGRRRLALVLHDPAGADAGEADGRRSGLLHRVQARQDRAGPELLRQGGAGGIQALLPQPGDHARHVRGLSRLRRRSISRWTPRISRPARRSRCPSLHPVGRDRQRRPQQPAGRQIWQNYATDIRGAKALPCGHYLSEEAPEETYADLRAFFKAQ